jgi:hypothetical protein
MKMKQIEVSDEYLDSLCKSLKAWSEKEDSLTMPQFLKEKGIGYPYFKYFIYRSPKVNNTYEVAKSTLSARWLSKAMDHKDMPNHQAKVLMRYLTLYDSHGRDMDQQAKEAIAEVEKKAELNFITDNYASAKLDGDYKQHYEVNANKRGSDSKAK